MLESACSWLRIACYVFLSPWQECLGPMTHDPMHNNGRQCAPLLFAARLGIDNLSPTQLFFYWLPQLRSAVMRKDTVTANCHWEKSFSKFFKVFLTRNRFSKLFFEIVCMASPETMPSHAGPWPVWLRHAEATLNQDVSKMVLRCLKMFC